MKLHVFITVDTTIVFKCFEYNSFKQRGGDVSAEKRKAFFFKRVFGMYAEWCISVKDLSGPSALLRTYTSMIIILLRYLTSMDKFGEEFYYSIQRRVIIIYL